MGFVSWPGIGPRPWHWKHQILISRSPGNSQRASTFKKTYCEHTPPPPRPRQTASETAWTGWGAEASVQSRCAPHSPEPGQALLQGVCTFPFLKPSHAAWVAAAQPTWFINIYRNGVLHCWVRYSQLLGLHEQLRKEYGTNVLPAFPPKKLLSFDTCWGETRESS